LQQALVFLTSLSASFNEPRLSYPTWEDNGAFSLRITDLSADLTYLIDELISTGIRVDEMRKSVRALNNPTLFGYL